MGSDVNQTPEQIARDAIDKMLIQSGWAVQNKAKINFNASLGVAVREYQTDVGPADPDFTFYKPETLKEYLKATNHLEPSFKNAFPLPLYLRGT